MTLLVQCVIALACRRYEDTDYLTEWFWSRLRERRLEQ